MNILDQFYVMRKRLTDKNLLKMQEMVQSEIDRRAIADNKNPTNE